MVVATDVVLVKATPYRALLHFLDREVEPEVRARIVDEAAKEFPEHEAMLRARSVIVSERVPVTMINRMIELAAGEMRIPRAVLAHRIGRAAAEEAAGGVLRLALTLISIPNLLRKLGPVWSQLYTHGTMTSRSEGRSATIELTDFPLASATGCARVTGWFEWFSQRAEKTASARHTSCRADGAPIEQWVVKW